MELAIVFDQEVYMIAEDWHPTDILFIILPAFVLALGMFLLFKYRLHGNHGKARLFFVLVITSTSGNYYR